MKISYIILAILGIAILFTGCTGCSVYNNIVSSEQDVVQSWANVEANYQRRTDLYTSVVSVVEASANFEKSTLVEVTQARASATAIKVDINDPATLAAFQKAQGTLQSVFSKLMVSIEKYPDLKTTSQFAGFQAQIEGTENRINISRQTYNEKVNTYNRYIKTFPQNILANMFNFKEKQYYKADEGTKNPPKINFNIK